MPTDHTALVRALEQEAVTVAAEYSGDTAHWLREAAAALTALGAERDEACEGESARAQERDEALKDVAWAANLAGDALGTDPALRSIGCVQAVCDWLTDVRRERDAAEARERTLRAALERLVAHDRAADARAELPPCVELDEAEAALRGATPEGRAHGAEGTTR